VYLNKRFEDLIQRKIGKQLEGLPKSEVLEAMAEVCLSFTLLEEQYKIF